MRFIDTHSHLNFKKFNEDAEQVILNSLENDVGMVIVGTNYKTSRKALDLANKYEKGIYATVGVHPIHLEDITEMTEDGREIIRVAKDEFNYETFLKLAQFEKVVAIGEIGLDYYYLKIDENLEKTKNKQKEVLWQQLSLARELDLPVIIHCRQAHGDLLPLLKDFKDEFKDSFQSSEPWGVMHCFSGDEDLAWKYFNLGLIISFTGLITFSAQWDDLIRKMPLSKLMIETDCPYMTPEPYRGKRNEPVFVELVGERVAQIRGEKIDNIAKVLMENSQRFFGI